jgi:hypothetical protein
VIPLVQTCGTCRYGSQAAGDLLFCRRYPPVLGTPPLVTRADWCGEWEAPVLPVAVVPIVTALLVWLLSVLPAAAQTPNYKGVVVAARAKYAAMSGPERAYCVVNQTAWDLKGEGGGLFFKPSGNNVKQRSIDIVMFYPGAQTYDVLADAEGKAIPRWEPTKPTGRGDPAKWRAATDPDMTEGCVTGPVVAPPIQPPPDTCPPDQSVQVAALQQQVAALTAENLRLDAQLKEWDARLNSCLQEKDALQHQLDNVRCKALFGVPCTVIK